MKLLKLSACREATSVHNPNCSHAYSFRRFPVRTVDKQKTKELTRRDHSEPNQPHLRRLAESTQRIEVRAQGSTVEPARRILQLARESVGRLRAVHLFEKPQPGPGIRFDIDRPDLGTARSEEHTP